MDKVRYLYVTYNDRKVGTLALYNSTYVAFAYDKDWLIDGFSISPFSLPLEEKVFIPEMNPFNGLYGVFADSLPGSWGRLLVDHVMLKQNINLSDVGNLERLAIVGNSGMGALGYEPAKKLLVTGQPDIDLDGFAQGSKEILKKKSKALVDDLFVLGGSSGGAGPKILVELNEEKWIVKFPLPYDDKNSGRQEYDYSLCAKECGIMMEDTRLFASSHCEGYFVTKRFDRMSDGKAHVISVNGLLEVWRRKPKLDYDTLMKLTFEMTKDYSEIEKLYRLMCFNVFSHNRDDHSKNFSFIYDEKESRWKLAPAYDLTYSRPFDGKRATTLLGNDVNPGKKEIFTIAKRIGLNQKKAKVIADDVQECVKSKLSEYLLSSRVRKITI